MSQPLYERLSERIAHIELELEGATERVQSAVRDVRTLETVHQELLSLKTDE